MTARKVYPKPFWSNELRRNGSWVVTYRDGDRLRYVEVPGVQYQDQEAEAVKAARKMKLAA